MGRPDVAATCAPPAALTIDNAAKRRTRIRLDSTVESPRVRCFARKDARRPFLQNARIAERESQESSLLHSMCRGTGAPPLSNSRPRRRRNGAGARSPLAPTPLRTAVDCRYGVGVAVESFIVVEHRKELTYLLCQAAELEHALMCQYLYAAFSLEEHRVRASGGSVGAVERWRQVILGVSAEEMLHWAVVQNLLTAVGSAPFVSRPHMPHQAKGYPPGVQLRLLPFGEAALQHFVYLERPEGDGGRRRRGFEPVGPGARTDAPRGDRAAGAGVRHRRAICTARSRAASPTWPTKLGEDRLFIGPAFHQADETTFGWPDLAPITDLEGANRAIERIVEQGEGARATGRRPTTAASSACSRSTGQCVRTTPTSTAHPVVAAGDRGVEGSNRTCSSPTRRPAATRTSSTPSTT